MTGANRQSTDDVAAAAAWRAWWTDEAIRHRTLEEIALAEQLAVARLRQLSYDLAGAIDWKGRSSAWKSADAWARLRVYDAPAPRQAQPWTADDLDRDNWRESNPPPPRWMFGPGPIRAAEGGDAA